jgi:hypothetical protein
MHKEPFSRRESSILKGRSVEACPLPDGASIVGDFYFLPLTSAGDDAGEVPISFLLIAELEAVEAQTRARERSGRGEIRQEGTISLPQRLQRLVELRQIFFMAERPRRRCNKGAGAKKSRIQGGRLGPVKLVLSHGVMIKRNAGEEILGGHIRAFPVRENKMMGNLKNAVTDAMLLAGHRLLV